MFTIQFGTATKKKNSTKIEAVGDSHSCLLLDNTSIITPIFKIRWDSPSSIFEYNYCYVPQMNRYYFITDIVSENSVIFYIHCEVDVLATFRDDILKTEAFVKYSTSNGNPSLPDPRLPKAVTSQVKVTKQIVPKFVPAGSFSVTVASDGDGTTGVSQTYMLTSAACAQMAKKLYDPSLLESLVQYLTNPLDAIISCMWTPLLPEGPHGTVHIGGQEIISGSMPPRTIEFSFAFSVDLLYSPFTPAEGIERYTDYRNVEPYAEHFMYLPGVGLQQINMGLFIGTGVSTSFTIYVDGAISPCTGAILYKLRRQDSDTPVMVLNGNLGVQVPIAQKNMGFAPAVTNLATDVGQAAVIASVLNPEMAMINLGKDFTSALTQTMTQRTTVSGSIGAWACRTEDYTTASITSIYYDISDDPRAGVRVIGRPLFQTKILDTIRGFCLCQGAYVECWGTKTESDMISMFLNNVGNQPYGGVYIE